MSRKKGFRNWKPEYPEKCPNCGSKTTFGKYDNGAEVYCINNCPSAEEEEICNPKIKCVSCEYSRECSGCKIPYGKACNWEIWIENPLHPDNLVLASAIATKPAKRDAT